MTYRWDTDGNGTFDDASGPTPTIAAAPLGSRLVGVEVTSDTGLRTLAYSRVTVTSDPPNPPATNPSARNLNVLELDNTEEFSIGTDQPVRWLVDDTQVATGNSFDYAPTMLRQVGTHRITALVGASDRPPVRFDWLRIVQAADADSDGWRANTDCRDEDRRISPAASEIRGNGVDDDCDVATADQPGKVPLADSVTGFSGRQGQANWYYGYYPDPPDPSFIEMTQFESYGPLDGAWWVENGRYWTNLTARGGSPQSPATSGGREPVLQWAVRRWVSPFRGPVRITGRLAKRGDDAIGGDGVIGRILLDGVEVWSHAIDGDDVEGIMFSAVVNVSRGSTVDFAFDPSESDLVDSSLLTAAISTEVDWSLLTVDDLTLSGAAGGATTTTLRTGVPADNPVTYRVVDPPVHGQATISGDQLTYTPDAQFVGRDAFTYTASRIEDDGATTTSAPGLITLSVNAADDPVIGPVAPLVVAVGQSGVREVVALAARPDELALTASGVPPSATFVDRGDGRGALTAGPGSLAGNYDVTVTAQTTTGRASAPVRLIVTGNRPPAAQNEHTTTLADTPVDVMLDASDPDRDPLSFAVLAGPVRGSTTGSGPVFIYTPSAGYTGQDGFIVATSDGQATTTRAVRIDVNPRNVPEPDPGPTPGPPAAPSPVPSFPSAIPLPKVNAAASLPSARRCVSRRRFRIRIRAPKARVTRAELSVNGKRVKVVRGKQLTAPIDLRGLPRGRFTVAIKLILADGRTVSAKRRYRTCAAKRTRPPMKP